MFPLSILWVDLLTIRTDTDLCSSLPPLYQAHRLRHLADLLHSIQKWRPSALCLECDRADGPGRDALLEVRTRHASLPIIMLTEQGIGQHEVLALRDCVWDHLVKPVSVTRFCRCLTGLTRATVPAVAPPTAAIQVASPTLAARKTWTAGSLAPAMSYVAENYSEKLRQSTAAKLCDLSSFQFSRTFKKEYGLTFRDFVVQLRIQRAAELMRRSQAVSVTEAAFVVGFNDLSHFSRMFRRQLGVTPSYYRRAEKEPCQLPLFASDDDTNKT